MSSYKALSDNELIQLLKSDDELALSALYLRYWDKLLTVACNRFNEPEEAEEVVQDIFFKLWLHRKDLELKYSLATYLSVAVKYRVINLMDRRHRKRNKEMLLPDFSTQTSPSAEEYLFEKELQSQINASIKQLPEKCRIVFTMSREQGLTYKQISRELDISKKTVEAHISKALKDIRGNLTTVLPAAIFYLIEQNKFLS